MILVEAQPSHPFRVAHDIDWAATRALRIVHVGQSGTLLEGTEESAGVLVPVTWGDRGLVPGGLALGALDASRFRRGLFRAVHEAASVNVTEWSRVSSDRMATVDLRLPPIRIDAAATARLSSLLAAGGPRTWADPTMDPGPQRAIAPVLAAAVVIGDHRRVRELVLGLVGSGPGATPAGDDVIVGTLVALRVAVAQQMLSSGSLQSQRSLAVAVTDALDRTTAASRHDLSAALKGSFSERFIHMTSGLENLDRADRAYGAALGWGATSGLDFLHGLVRTVDAVLQHRPSRLPSTA